MLILNELEFNNIVALTLWPVTLFTVNDDIIAMTTDWSMLAAQILTLPLIYTV